MRQGGEEEPLLGVPDHAGDPVGTSRWATLPNFLTLIRLLLVPVLAVLLLAEDGADPALRWAATAVFVIAALTVTTLGKIADPVADKALTGVALIGLSILGALPWWVTIIILGREIAVTVLRFVVIRHGVIPASRGGKVKTVAQVIAIALYLAPLGEWADPLRIITMGIAVVLTIVTGIDYAMRAWRMSRAQR